MIFYQIKPLDPNAHLFQVKLLLNDPVGSGQIFSLPNWIPGSYMIRDFARNIVQIRASTDDGKPVNLVKLDKNHWQAESVPGTLMLEYEVYAWDLSVRAAHLDNVHGFFNGTSVFLSVEGTQDQPISVEILAPDGKRHNGWKLASSLTPIEIDENGFGKFSASNYDELIDHPVEMGCFTRITFDACGVPHDVVLTGKFDADLDRLGSDLKIICEHHIRFFAEPAPMDRYLFLVMIVGKGYGGLEHRASTSLLASRKHLPAKKTVDINDDYLEFLGLCSHEYFHTWNVKRIKPAVFVPYQLNNESYTQLLWAFEGITSYYDELALVRCGLIDQQRYLTLLGKTITRVYRGKGRLKQSIAESSFDAWSKFYKQDENAPNAIVSYYVKGALVALLLDCEMRRQSGGSVSLDDLMKRLWQRWQDTGNGVGELEIEQTATDLLGKPLTEFFNQAVRSTRDLPLQALLSQVGVDLQWRAAKSQSDMGGEALQHKREPLTLGIRTKEHPKGLEITHVFDDGAAQKSGLSAGDIVIAVDGEASNQEALDAYLIRRCKGDTITFHYFRYDMLYQLEMKLEAASQDTCYLTVSEMGQEQCNNWLSSPQVRS